VHKNGTIVSTSVAEAKLTAATDTQIVHMQCLVTLGAGDYVEVWACIVSGQTSTTLTAKFLSLQIVSLN
jgi:hypothetical protein